MCLAPFSASRTLFRSPLTSGGRHTECAFCLGQVTIQWMTTSPARLDLIATSTFGLEAVVARELQSLGYEPKIIQPGRVLFAGDESDICRTNLWLRTADRVLVRIDTFEARDFG